MKQIEILAFLRKAVLNLTIGPCTCENKHYSRPRPARLRGLAGPRVGLGCGGTVEAGKVAHQGPGFAYSFSLRDGDREKRAARRTLRTGYCDR